MNPNYNQRYYPPGARNPYPYPISHPKPYPNPYPNPYPYPYPYPYTYPQQYPQPHYPPYPYYPHPHPRPHPYHQHQGRHRRPRPHSIIWANKKKAINDAAAEVANKAKEAEEIPDQAVQIAKEAILKALEKNNNALSGEIKKLKI
ncbi:pleckstrin homology-like domain family A member 1 [Drosophila takahashii]|uniref:pleckstrin homology-like domain family A member 1 n=1 Tax=Drosophila takahashii TaxID=29030 RepID=UPI001CF9244B|nr:pleckstrin homology-like domain family A member 1 [Drosophila takahashii]